MEIPLILFSVLCCILFLTGIIFLTCIAHSQVVTTTTTNNNNEESSSGPSEPAAAAPARRATNERRVLLGPGREPIGTVRECRSPMDALMGSDSEDDDDDDDDDDAAGVRETFGEDLEGGITLVTETTVEFGDIGSLGGTPGGECYMQFDGSAILIEGI